MVKKGLDSKLRSNLNKVLRISRLEARSCVQAVIDELEEIVPGTVRGAFVGGATGGRIEVASGWDAIPDSDLDVYIVLSRVENDTRIKVKIDEKFGRRLQLEGFPRYKSLGLIPCDRIVADVGWLSDLDFLVSSHDCMAFASSLFHSDLLVDPSGILSEAQLKIRRQFLHPGFIHARLLFELESGLQGLARCSQKLTPFRALWHGRMWALMCVGTMWITARGRTPTFRRHLFAVQESTNYFSCARDFEELINYWGVSKLNTDEARALTALVEELFDHVVIAGISEREFSEAKRGYYLDAICRMNKLGLHSHALWLALMVTRNALGYHERKIVRLPESAITQAHLLFRKMGHALEDPIAVAQSSEEVRQFLSISYERIVRLVM